MDWFATYYTSPEVKKKHLRGVIITTMLKDVKYLLAYTIPVATVFALSKEGAL